MVCEARGNVKGRYRRHGTYIQASAGAVQTSL